MSTPNEKSQKPSILQYVIFPFAAIGACTLLSKGSKLFQSFYPLMIPKKNLSKIYGKNSWVAITGSSDGLGKQFAHEFSSYGFNCLLIARNETKIKTVENELQTKFPNIQYKIVLADFKKVLEPNFSDNLQKEFSNLDVKILVNNVGVTSVSNFFNASDNEIKEQIFINSYATVLMSRLFLNKIIETRKKTGKSEKCAIINIGSILGKIPLPYLSIYCGTKAFVNNFSESLDYEFRGQNLDVFCLTPYYVSTKMTGFKKLSFDTITPEECVSSALKQFARGKKKSSGNWKHELISSMLGNEWFKEYLIKNKREFYKDLVDRAEKVKELRKKREQTKK